MINKKQLAVFLISLFYIATASAQFNSDLLKRRAAEKVGQMNDYISFMASKKKSVEVRQKYRKEALNLFIGEGNSYEENGVQKEGVLMEVTSVNRPGKRRELIRDYFSRIIMFNYNDVNISSTEIAEIKVSNLQILVSAKNE